MADDPTVAVELSEMRRSIDVSHAEMTGHLTAIRQQLDEQARRTDEQIRRIDDHDVRLRTVERDSVTHAQLSSRFKQVIAVVSLIVAIAGTILGVYTGVSS